MEYDSFELPHKIVDFTFQQAISTPRHRLVWELFRNLPIRRRNVQSDYHRFVMIKSPLTHSKTDQNHFLVLRIVGFHYIEDLHLHVKITDSKISPLYMTYNNEIFVEFMV